MRNTFLCVNGKFIYLFLYLRRLKVRPNRNLLKSCYLLSNGLTNILEATYFT